MLQYWQQGVSQCVCVWDDCDLCVPCAAYSDDLWRLSLETLEWTRIEVAPGAGRPSGRVMHTMTAVGRDLLFYEYGGTLIPSGFPYSLYYVFQFLQHGVSRCVCGVCVDCDLRVSCAGIFDELWRLSLETLEWTRIEVATGSARPSARREHTMTVVGMDLWVFGGTTSSGEDDVCVTVLATWSVSVCLWSVCGL